MPSHGIETIASSPSCAAATFSRGVNVPGRERLLEGGGGLVGPLLAPRAHDDLVAGRGEVDREATAEVSGAAENRDLHLVSRLRWIGLRAARRRAASSVFFNRYAMVMGPTPPGTGVSQPATSRASSPRDVAAQPRVRAVDAHVDDGGARLDPVAPDHLGPADGGHEDVGRAAERLQVARARVRHRHRRAAGRQQQRHRLADDQAAPDDHRVRALEGDPGAVEHPHHARGGAGHRPRLAADQAARG